VKTTGIEAATARRLLPPASLDTLERLRRAWHGQCFACGQGLFRLEFALEEGDVLTAPLTLDRFFCGYEGAVHGGALALFLDQMAACVLFAHGVVAVTAEMRVRYRAPVRPDCAARLQGRVEAWREPVFTVRVWLEQERRTVVSADLRMWRRASGRPPGGRRGLET
jgi:acyl-coenzyme A thioesterase PaaI-like protein